MLYGRHRFIIKLILTKIIASLETTRNLFYILTPIPVFSCPYPLLSPDKFYWSTHNHKNNKSDMEMDQPIILHLALRRRDRRAMGGCIDCDEAASG